MSPPCLQLWIIPSILGSSNLYFLSDDDWETVSAWIYGLGLCGLFVVSTVFHTVSWKKSHLRCLLPSPREGCELGGRPGVGPTAGRGRQGVELASGMPAHVLEHFLSSPGLSANSVLPHRAPWHLPTSPLFSDEGTEGKGLVQDRGP